MKNSYFQKTTGFIFLFLLLLTGNSLFAQNKSFLDFDGSNDYVKYTDDATLDNLNGASNYTLEAWVYVSSSCASGAQILHRTNQFYIYYYSSGSYPDALDFKVYDGSDYQLYYTNKNTLTTNTWHHIAVIRNTSLTHYLHIYIDGVDQISADKNAYALTSSNNKNLYIGNDGNSGNYFKGYIDEVCLKNVAVNVANLQSHIYDNQYFSDVNTAALFHFNEGSTQYTKNEASGSNARLGSSTDGDAAEPAWRAWNYVSSHHLPLAHEWTGATNSNWGTSGNWVGDVPAAANDVIVPSGLTNYPEVSGDATTPSACNNLSCESGASLTVPAGKALTINGNLTNSGTLTVASDNTGNGSLIVNGTVTGSATVQRYIAKYSATENGWHEISSPVDNQAISGSGFEPGGDDDLYRWDEANNIWENYKPTSGTTHPFSNYKNGRGYLVASNTTGTKNFSGTLNNTDIGFNDLSYNTDKGNGWHLLGNPYSSALKWGDANWHLSTSIVGTAQIWDESAGNYIGVSSGGIIPSTNGFFIQVTNTTNSLTIPKADRTHDAANNYKTAQVKKETLRFKVTNDANGYYDVATLGFKANATENCDNAFDSHKLFTMVKTAPSLWTVSQKQDFSTNFLPENTTMDAVPLDFKPGVSTIYHLSWQGMKSFGNRNFVLEDLKTGQKIDLNNINSYDFSAEKGDDVSRFVLHINGVTAVPNKNETDGIQVFSYGHTIYLHGQNTLTGRVSIFNTLGQEVYKGLLNGAAKQQIRLNQQSGIYFVRLEEGSRVITKKVFIQ